MAVESYTHAEAPTYPLDPSTTGSDELAIVRGLATGESWSVALTFALPETSSFSTQFDPLGATTLHPIAALRAPGDDDIEISLARTSRGDGLLVIDRFEDQLLIDRMTFSSLTFDRLDPIRLVISHQPNHLEATVLTMRDEFSLQSRAIVGSEKSIQPWDLVLSDASRTRVTPLEWHAIQVSNSQFLTAAEREQLIVSDLVFSRLDGAFPVGADFDQDGDVDGSDFVDWQAGFGTTFLTRKGDGDADGDGVVDHADFICWEHESQPAGSPLSADFDGNGQVDADDLAIWQAQYGIVCGAEHADGDGDGDGDVDGEDFLSWQIADRGANGVAASARQLPVGDALAGAHEAESAHTVARALALLADESDRGLAERRGFVVPPVIIAEAATRSVARARETVALADDHTPSVANSGDGQLQSAAFDGEPWWVEQTLPPLGSS